SAAAVSGPDCSGALRCGSFGCGAVDCWSPCPGADAGPDVDCSAAGAASGSCVVGADSSGPVDRVGWAGSLSIDSAATAIAAMSSKSSLPAEDWFVSGAAPLPRPAAAGAEASCAPLPGESAPGACACPGPGACACPDACPGPGACAGGRFAAAPVADIPMRRSI